MSFDWINLGIAILGGAVAVKVLMNDVKHITKNI